MTQPTIAIIGTRGYPSYYGGFETAVRSLAPYLADRGWDVTAYSRRRAVKLDDPQRDDRVRVTFTPGINRRALSTLTYGLTSMFHAAAKKPDVALIMNVANCVWIPLLRARRIPTVVNVDGIEWEREKWSRLARMIFKFGAHATAKWADEIVVDAKAIGARWQADFGRNGTFIPYGGDRSEPVSTPLGLERRQYVLLVSRFVPENSIVPFFDAVEKLAADHQIVLVGSSGFGGELDDRASALADRFPRVQWLGHLSDDRLLHSLWQNAGAYFHGHTVGGTNPALVQAMALGAPIVAVDTVYNREVLEDAAALTAADASAIASEISKVLRDPSLQEQMSQRGMDRATAEYSWDRVNALYEQRLADRAGVARNSSDRQSASA